MEQGHSAPPSIETLTRQVAELTALVNDLRGIVAQQQAQIAEQQATIVVYQEQLERQHAQIQLFKRALFASRRERYVPSAAQKLLLGFDMVESTGDTPADAQEPESEPPPAKPKRRRSVKRFVFPEGLPHRRTEYVLNEAELPCACCQQPRVVISQHVSRQLELEPAQPYIAEQVRYTYACPRCRAGESMQTSVKPPLPIEKSPFGPSVLATIGVNKYARHLPLYRQQESLLGPLRAWLSRPLMCRLMQGVAAALRPLVLRLGELILASHVVQVDETPVRYLDGTSPSALRGYLWAYAGDALRRYVLYDFQDSRSRDGPQAMLARYRGYLHSDGYAVYESLVAEAPERLVHVGCWAHTRRYFEAALYTTSHPLLHEALAAIQRLYDLETQSAAWPHEARQALRATHARPLVDRLQASLLRARDDVRPSSKLGEAVTYALNRWPTLQRYLDDGRLAIDTNHVERQIRPLAIGRANWLFIGRSSAGATTATMYTVLQSARLHQVDLLPYLTDVLRHLPAVELGNTAGVDAFLPDRWLAAHPEHRLIEREQESQAAQHRRRTRRAARRVACAT